MRRNRHGDPQPQTMEEIAEAMEEVFDLSYELQAQIFDSMQEPAPFEGFTAEISDAEHGEPRLCTCGFPDKEALIEGLVDLGILLIEDCA